MGSGLILLVIVGAWLAVLVPMALRSHDASNLGTVDKFHDAMRVLSRRDGRKEVEADEEPGAPSVPVPPSSESAPGLTPAARRRRALVVVVTVAVLTLVGALVGPLWLLVPHAAADLLLVGFVLWLRKQAVLRAEREWRAAMRTERRRPVDRTAPTATLSRPVEPLRVPSHMAGIPARMPSRAAVGVEELTLVRYEESAPVPARGAQGEPWSPVPVPVPTYVTAPTAPRSVPGRLTHPGEHAEGLAEAERALGIEDRGPELEDILDRRRAVGD